MARENLAQDLADLLATKNFDVKYTDEKGMDSTPADAKVFAFDWIASSGKNYGTVVIILGDDNDLQLFFGDNIGRTMDDPNDKLDWFGSERHPGFLEEMSRFATSHGLATFSPKNINQLKHTMAGMAAIKEGLFEGYYGNRRVSYMGEPTEARLVIRHNRMIGEDDKRYRYVESLFIETADGERFRLPFAKLSGGRAMLEHVRQGGRPYDIRGQHIAEIVSEMSVLSRFNRASQQRVFEGVTQALVETAQQYYAQLRDDLQSLSTGRGYQQYFESWSPADIADQSALVEDLKTMFIEQTLDARIEAALPTLAKIQQRGRAMKEAQIFENWANQIMEGTWALPDTPDAQKKLDNLMSSELIVGPDATNATEQLYDVIGDDQLFDILADLAQRDPRANIWNDTDVQARLAELGIQTPQSTEAEPADVAQDTAPGQQGVAEAAKWRDPKYQGQTFAYDDSYEGPGDTRAGKVSLDRAGMRQLPGQTFDPLGYKAREKQATGKLTPQDVKYATARNFEKEKQQQLDYDRSQGVAEDLDAMLRHAGVPVKESRIHENSEYTYEKVAKILAREKPGMATDKSNDDFYSAVYHELIAIGMTPKAARNLISYDEDFISDVATAYNHYQDRPGLDENNSEMVMPEADNISTFEVMSGFDAPVAEGSCNMTTEGEYCPEHGLAECGMSEQNVPIPSSSTAAIVKGSTQAASQGIGATRPNTANMPLSEKEDDPINRNAAITGSYYESDALARMKKLALGK